MIEFRIQEEYIELIKLLKAVHIASTGGHAKMLVEESEVIVNGVVEHRKRAKLRSGDTIKCAGRVVKIIK